MVNNKKGKVVYGLWLSQEEEKKINHLLSLKVISSKELAEIGEIIFSAKINNFFWRR